MNTNTNNTHNTPLSSYHLGGRESSVLTKKAEISSYTNPNETMRLGAIEMSNVMKDITLHENANTNKESTPRYSPDR